MPPPSLLWMKRWPRMHENQKLSPALWGVLTLLFLALFINYIDRGALSIAAPMIKDEFGMSPARLGVLLSAFFWTYASFLLISGWLADRFDASRVLAAGFLVWSAATLLTGVVQGFAGLFAMRLLHHTCQQSRRRPHEE